MKNTIKIFLILLYCHTIQSQTFTYFHKKIIIDGFNRQVSLATIPFNEGYYVAGLSGTEERYVYFAQLDEGGEIIDYHILDDSDGMSGGNDFIETPDGHLAVLHGKHVSASNSEITLVKFTKEGEILWVRQYGNEGFDSAGGVIATQDGGFAIVGTLQLQVGEPDIAMYAIKTDVNGIVEWENHYCLNRSCLGFSIDETLDGGYILGGVGDIENNNKDMYYVKIDSLGNQLWEQNYGFGRNDPACQVYPLENGSFLLKGGVVENNIDKHYFAHLDYQGNTIWEKKYNMNSHDATIQTPLVFREDGGFIGVSFKFTSDYTTYPLIMNFDNNANIIWTKHITADIFADNYVRDIDKIEGGYVLTGWKHNSPQYGWLVTIDEEGNFCEELGCVETVVDIEDVAVENDFFVRISPNPVREKTTIHYQIPKDGVLKVYDYQGKELETYPLIANERKFLLKVTDWTSGLYFYKVSIEEKEVDSGKLLID